MAEKILKTRIQLKYDTYANWTANNPTLKYGEVALVEIPAETGAVVQEPTILMKVGDGKSDFRTLTFTGAKAADVYSWAKAATKPTYKADEIEGLDAFIATEIQDTDTKYTITKVNAYQYKLMSKALGDESFSTEVAVIDIPNDTGAITALQNLVGSTSVATQIANALAAYSTTAQMTAAISTAKSEAISHSDGLNTAMDGRVSVLEGKFGEGEGTVESQIAAAVAAEKAAREAAVSGVQGEVDALEQAHATDKAALEGSIADDVAARETLAGRVATVEGDYLKSADKTDLEGKITAEANTARAAEKANADAIAAIKDGVEIDSFADVEAAISELESGESGLGDRVAAIEADYLKGADKTELNGKIKSNTDAIALLNNSSTVEGSVDYKIAQAVAAIMENPDETMNSINELVTWINGHADDALALSNKVTANEQDIAALEGLVGSTGVADQIAAAIEAALKVDGVDKYALATDLTAAIARVAALEGKVATWNAAEKNAKDYADGLNSAMNTRVEALEAIDHEHANKGVLDGITAVKVSAWDAAEQNAKKYADGLAKNYDAAGAAAAVETKLEAYKTANNAEVAKKANDADLAAVAKTGNVNDLVQTAGDVLVFDCGTSAN